MIGKPLSSITAADIQRLVAEATPEGRSIEFKRETPGPKDSDRKEFLADVSSFANATGGDLIYGVEEKDGCAAVAEGLAIANIDAEVLRLDQMIRSGISPRIVGCQTQVVPGLPKGAAIIIRVPRSWQGLHIVSYQQDFRFYSRSTNGKFRMDATDVRDAVLSVGALEERMRLFRTDRVARVVADETPVPLDGTKRIVVHVIPFSAQANPATVDLIKAAGRSDLLQPLYADGWNGPLFNIDGIHTYVNTGAEASYAYLQLRRNGAIEAVDAAMMTSPDPSRYPHAMPSQRFPQEIFALLSRILRLYDLLEIQPPYAVFISLVGAKGVQLATKARFGIRSPIRPLDRDVLLLPELVIQERGADIQTSIRPILDALWQSFGADRCPDYDDSGQWRPQQ